MRRALAVAALLLAGRIGAQPANGWQPLSNGWSELKTTAPTGTVTTTGTLASGQVALGSGATSITSNDGLTHQGSGTTFKLGLGTRVFLSAPSAGTLLVEDGAGSARDVQARTGTFDTSVVTPLVSGGADSATPNATAINGTNSRGGTDTNVAGGNLTIRPGAGTGSATGSSLIFQTPTAGASGTTGQTQTTRLTISEAVGMQSSASTRIISGYAGSLAMAVVNGGLYTWFGNNGSGDFELADSGGTPILTLKQAGNVVTTAPVRLKGYTVATLPAGTVGDTAYVTDALAPAFGVTVVGTGAVTIPVFFDGANWIAH